MDFRSEYLGCILWNHILDDRDVNNYSDLNMNCKEQLCQIALHVTSPAGRQFAQVSFDPPPVFILKYGDSAGWIYLRNPVAVDSALS